MTAEPRHCIKCGREIGPDESICEVCNRAGMVAPSASQYHGTVVVAIVLAVAALAFAASLSLRGIGPWSAEVVGVSADRVAGVTITVSVTNEGTKAGNAKCRIEAYDASGSRIRTRNFTAPRIDGGEHATSEQRLPDLEDEPAELFVECS